MVRIHIPYQTARVQSITKLKITSISSRRRRRRRRRRRHPSSMEIISPTSIIPCNSSHLQSSPPLFNSSSSLSFSTKQQHIHRLQTPLLNSNLSLFPRRKPLATTRSVSDDGVSGLATNVIEVDPSIAVKKRAIEISPELKGTSIFLVGMKSAIKTSLGKLLADALRYYYFDSDSLVEEAAGGASDSKSFKERDEKGFHESETEVLRQLSSMGRLVVCAGDGAVQCSTNLAFLRHGITMWIDVPLDMVAKEMIKDGSLRTIPETPTQGPSEANDDQVFSQLIALYEESRDGYATADATISLQRVASQLGFDDLNEVTTEDMALEVLKELEKLTRSKKLMEEAARPF